MFMKTVFVNFLILLSTSGGLIFGQKISEWRPENRTGVSAEKGLLRSWHAEGPSLKWLNLELAKGYSSPS
jgi:outer membrane protein assembly factor BamB